MDNVSLWEFSSAVSGWAKANGGESKPDAPTDEEHDDLVARYQHV